MPVRREGALAQRWKRATDRDLHLKTSTILDQVVSGFSFVIERRGTPVAELRPLTIPPSTRKLPDRERRLAMLPAALDSGRILEHDRT
jgi:antitoxin (DNA-binding transcriptional repressor) of toxin-antitoxin stability system